MKKTFKILTALLLSALLFASCQSGDTNDTEGAKETPKATDTESASETEKETEKETETEAESESETEAAEDSETEEATEESSETEPETEPAPALVYDLDILCIGDSNMFGAGTGSSAHVPSTLLKSLLDSASTVRNFGVKGAGGRNGEATYDEGCKFFLETNAVRQLKRSKDADYAFIMLGYDDAKYIVGAEAAFEAGLKEVCDTVAALNDKIQIVLLTPSFTADMEAEDYDALIANYENVLNPIVKKVADERGYGFGDFWTASKTEFEENAVMLFTDDGKLLKYEGTSFLAKYIFNTFLADKGVPAETEAAEETAEAADGE